VDGLGRRTASGYAGNRDDGPRNRTEAETHADRRVRPNAPPEEKDIGTAALRLIRDDCQAGSVRKLRHTLSAQRPGSQEQTQIIASAIGKPAAKAPTIVKVNAESKFISGRNCSTDMAACSTARKVKKPSPGRSGDGF